TLAAAGTFSITTAASQAVTSITVTGSLPTGVTFVDNGNGTATLSGTPAALALAAREYPLTLTATGPGGTTTQSLTLKVMEVASITSAANATLTVNVAGPAFTVTTSGVPTAALTQSGSLPSGVTFTDNGNDTATLTGTPAAGTGGAHSLTFTATNGVGT